MNMKKLVCLWACLLLCSGCQPKPDASSQQDITQSRGNSATESTADSDDSSVSAKIPDAKPITLCTQSAAALSETINAQPNMTAVDSFVIDVPEAAPIYEYISEAGGTYDGMEACDRQFRALFAYFFPDRAINNEHLYYQGGSSELRYANDGSVAQDFNLVSEWYDKIMAGDEGRVNYLYDETWKRDVTEWNGQVCLELGLPVGYGYSVLNKGKTVSLHHPKVYDEVLGAERYPLLESYDPKDWLTVVGTYSPDSTESFSLADKEVPINEAVTFFERYINALPYPEEANLETKVSDVDVLQVTEKIYGYYFHTVACYEGVPFDHYPDGTVNSSGDYGMLGGNAFMVESDDVDVLYGMYRLQDMKSVKAYDTVISPETAIARISSSLSQYLPFEAQSLEFVYTKKWITTEEGYVNIETYASEVVPAWKMTLYYPNDDLTYICYVDALDGENFRYYTVT